MSTSLCLIYKAHYIEFNSFAAQMLELSFLIKWLKNVGEKTAGNGLGIIPCLLNEIQSSDPCFKVQVLFSALLAASPPAPFLGDNQTWGIISLKSFLCIHAHRTSLSSGSPFFSCQLGSLHLSLAFLKHLKCLMINC